ncbi:oligosaccharide flippase family protein [Thiothrix lacustris]|uniref:Oligosaccharide flippase family protein n=1 Tax=Thiothrix lacustris TaxID=525917 RepID=A0ABY9MMC4_9GAMM|nr:oligosaccharide flippase family protein [Thiothrix lacustris]WML89814.1 oligosaccharide flippase family protein [Thiothrix lacustris]
MIKTTVPRKNIRSNVIFSVLGYALPLLAALATIPIMVRALGTDLYGLYIICTSLIGFMALVDLGIGQTVIKYVAEYEATNQQAKVQPVLNVALLVYLVIGLCSAMALFVFSSNIASALYDDPQKQALAQKVLQITAFPLFFSYMNQFFLNVCKAYHRFDLPAVVHNAGNLGGIVLATVLLLLGYGLEEVLWGYVVVQGGVLIAGYSIGRHVLPDAIRLWPVFDKKIFDEIVSFSFYTFIGNFVSSVAARADKLVIGVILGTEAVTYYQIPFTIAQMANGIIHALVNIAFPRFSEMSVTGNKQGLLSLYRKVGQIMSLISTVIAVLLITVGGSFLALWISPEFAQQATLTLQIIALYFFLHSNTVTGYWVLQGSGEAKLTALIAVIGTVAYFVGMYYLGGHYAHNGVAFALFLLLLAVPLQYMWISRYVGHRVVEYVLQLVSFAVLGYFMVYGLEIVNTWLDSHLLEILVDGLLGVLVLLPGVYWLLKRKDDEGEGFETPPLLKGRS